MEGQSVNSPNILKKGMGKKNERLCGVKGLNPKAAYSRPKGKRENGGRYSRRCEANGTTRGKKSEKNLVGEFIKRAY